MSQEPPEKAPQQHDAALPADGEAALPEDESAGLGADEETAAEEVEFDLHAQIAEFRRQIEADPDNCIHHYNLGEALEEARQHDAAQAEFELALQLDRDQAFAAIIHFGLGNLHYNKLMRGTSSLVVKTSVGLMSEHKDKHTITRVNDEDYQTPIAAFEQAVKSLPALKADDDLAEHISKNAPLHIASTYYKWGSDLIDKSRQLAAYGGEIQDVKQALKNFKKTLEIDPGNSAAKLMANVAKKMLTEGWKIFDEYGFEAKDIPGSG